MGLLFFQNILRKIGVDGPIFYTVLSRLIQAGGGIVTMFLIANFLGKEEQGYYYTFASVLAIQIFFELGLGGIIVQFVAHEMAHITVANNVDVEGDVVSVSRLSSLVQFCFRWYMVVSVLLFIILFASGFVFFSNYGSDNYSVNWKNPWLFVCIFTCLNLLLSPISSILQGMGKVKDVAKIVLIQQIFTILITWASLLFKAGLFLTAISSLTSFTSLIILYIYSPFPKLLLNLYRSNGDYKINYVKEILPLQWRIALSWISGYFIFQLFNPVLFAFQGPIVAGKMGMTLSLLNAITSLVLSWSATKIPMWSSFIALKDYKALDISLARVVKDSTIICIGCVAISIIFLGVASFLHLSIAERFLSPWLCALFFVSIPVNNIINCFANYLRCHKKEPFLPLSLTVGILCGVSTYFAGKYLNTDFVVIGYCCIVFFVSFPLAYYIFRTKRATYHNEELASDHYSNNRNNAQ